MLLLLPAQARLHAHGKLVRLSRARDRLREIHDREWSLEKIAREAGLSPYHFIRSYKAVFGETPHQVRIAARLELAKRLLMAGEQSVTDVCSEVGFSSLGTFSGLFARRVGVPPSLYRARMRPMIQVPGVVPRSLTPGCFSLMFGWPE